MSLHPVIERINDASVAGDGAGAHFDIAAELRAFEAEERSRLGMDGPKAQYIENVASGFQAQQREHTTILVCGLTMAHDHLIEGALRGMGYRMQALDVPNNDALRIGKEFGNRGQCNPTYFTVGNLVKHLQSLRDGGMSVEDIINKHIFLTAGACGPCRFGMYVTEYRKALRDAGFDGFRVMLFQQQGGIKQATGDDDGIEFNPGFFARVVGSLLFGDVINALAYKSRPYEVESGQTDAAVDYAKEIAYRALHDNTSLVVAMLKIRKRFGAIEVDRTKVCPKVAIIGEFWAMTTEGDGNYHMQRFLESEGAEVDVQLLVNWLLFMVWENVRDTRERIELRGADEGRKGLRGKDPEKKLVMLFGAEAIVRTLFQGMANVMGLHGHHLPDMYNIADVAADYYNNEVRGGEAHMEVGKLILNTKKKKATMTLSVKPFGCMPSSGVSDGVQSMITEKYPEALYLPIETSGDGAVNVYSRVQMALFKARAKAEFEVQDAEERDGITREDAAALLQNVPLVRSPFFPLPHKYSNTAADAVAFAGALRNPLRAIKSRVAKAAGFVEPAEGAINTNHDIAEAAE